MGATSASHSSMKIFSQSAAIGYKSTTSGYASNSDDALFDDIISLVMSSAEQSVMMSFNCVHLSCL